MAILTLDRPVKYTTKIQPICLTPACFDTDAMQPIGMGWGLIESKGEGSEYVRHAVLPVVDNKKCQEIYQEMDNIIDSMICAHGYEQDTCQVILTMITEIWHIVCLMYRIILKL